MSVKVNILENGEGVEVLAYGIVTGHEIIKAHEKIYDEEYLSKQKYHIVDKSKCTEYNVTVQDIKSFAKLDKQASEINPNIVIAVIESEILQFSLTELWQAYIKECVFKTRSFVDRNAALEWIADNKII